MADSLCRAENAEADEKNALQYRDFDGRSRLHGYMLSLLTPIFNDILYSHLRRRRTACVSGWSAAQERGGEIMIYLELFLTFLQIGAVSFGGGYAMIPLIREQALMHGWLTEEALLNMIAVSESTPGPIAVNMATFVGSTQGGILGSLMATLGVVLPSFVIILIIAALIRGLLRYKGVQAVLGGVRPCVIALILATALTMLMSTLFSFKAIGSAVSPDVKGLIIFAIVAVTALVFKKRRKKPLSPILLILISAGLGMLMYSL
jgi:chromate transporter